MSFDPDAYLAKVNKSQSGTEFDPDAFLEKIGSTKKADSSSKTESAIEGFGEGATLGYLNNIQAALEPTAFKIFNTLTGKEVQADDYLKARDYYNKRQESLKAENPKSFGIGQFAGTLASSIPVAKAAQGATLAARAANAAKAGAAYGAIQNTSEKENELGGLDLLDRAVNAGTGAAFGAASSLGADAIGKSLTGAYSLKNKIGKSLKSSAEKLAENATGATRVQAEKYSDDAGRYLLDNKIVSFGDDAEKIAQKSFNKIKNAEEAIDSSLKSLDSKGATVSQDSIIQKIQSKISDLQKDPSQADVVKKLNSIVNDIIETGESKISATSAEQVKRGFNKMAKNWQDPEKGQAGKIAYRAYKEAVEDTAKSVDPTLLSQFKEAKNVYGKLMPIADAAEKRALQLSQHPFGGLLDTNTIAAGALGTAAGGFGTGDMTTGLGAGLAAAAGRRFIAPKIGSSLAVTLDKVSKQLLKDPKMFDLAKSSPEAFKSIVYSFSKPLEKDISIGIQSIAQSAKGPEKWAAVGAENLINSGLSQDQVEILKKSKKGQSILQRASDLTPNSKAMNNLIGELQNMGGE